MNRGGCKTGRKKEPRGGCKIGKRNPDFKEKPRPAPKPTKKFSDDVSDVKTKAPTIKKGTKIKPTFGTGKKKFGRGKDKVKRKDKRAVIKLTSFDIDSYEPDNSFLDELFDSSKQETDLFKEQEAKFGTEFANREAYKRLGLKGK